MALKWLVLVLVLVFFYGSKDCNIASCQNITTTTENPVCVQNACSSKAKNGACDSQCNKKECMFDGLECTFGRNPWQHCDITNCSDSFQNGNCNPECDNENCLFDGFDCFLNGTAQAKCATEDICINAYDEDNCNATCNTLECAFDGYDCQNEKGHTSKLLGTITLELTSKLNISLYHVAKVTGYFMSTIARSGIYVKRYQTNLMEYRVSDNKFRIYYDVDARDRCGFPEGKNCWTRIDTIGNAIAAKLWKKGSASGELFALTGISVCGYDGVYAPKCYNVCSIGCENQECNIERKLCDCKDGYAGITCSMTCPGHCKVACSTEGDQPCIGNCKSGYLGTHCNQTCAQGQWGDFCAYNCSYKCNNGVCSPQTGFCTDGCQEGHSGQWCTVDCPKYYYGDRCKYKCGLCYLNVSCEPVTGKCPDGCGAGKQGVKCDEDCSNGTYGLGCKGRCDGCVDQQCNSVTGVCLNGCISSDRVGTKCIDPATIGAVDTGVSGGIIAGIVISLLLIVVGLAAGFFIWRRSKANLFNVELTKRDDQKIAETSETTTKDTAALINVDSKTETSNDNKTEAEIHESTQQKEETASVSQDMPTSDASDLPPPPSPGSASELPPSTDDLSEPLPPPDDLPPPPPDM